MSGTSGIPTYNSAPLNSNKKEETTAANPQPEPATAIESSITTAPQPATTSATATATAPSYSPVYATAHEPPQPAAVASLPTPTAAPQLGNLTATPTTKIASTTSQSPPAPQPGALPTPTGTTSTGPSVPPPPKAGEMVSPPAPQPGATQTFTNSYAYQRHPSGSHGSIPNSTSSPYSAVYPESSMGASRTQGLPTHYGSSSGGGADSIFPDDEPGLMNTAKGWMQSAGEKLAEVEAEVWKRINDAHGR
ncbi:hypothetical protein N7520_011616 [Penicillium odoratum]|uniref:uncharacterized protein n=1 Tax=Penicillium odoratum TaxID=1167516 RepID=UPI0025474736|nr:uncharacterized protein N7520_011616 [Penicillium odoratum]KAJ5746434.1 hypothetical protein N7520_011616 [Penicillium odoratum]